MTNHGKVRSVKQPEQLVMDDYSVWVSSNISKVTEPGSEEQPGFDGWEYDLVQYTKDEFIKAKAEENESLSAQMTGMQLALCEVYEMIP